MRGFGSERMQFLSKLPGGWRLVQLGDVAQLRRRQVTPTVDQMTPYVGLEHIASGGPLHGRGRAGESISNKTVFNRGDTLYGKLRPNLRKVVRVDFEGVCSTDILAVFAREPADGDFLGHVMRSDHLHGHAMRGISGTKMPRTSWSHLRRFHLPLPPVSEQRAIATALSAIDEAIERTAAVITATERLRDSLLHKLFTFGIPAWHSTWRSVPGLGMVPADWSVVSLKEVLVVNQPGAWGENPTPDDAGVRVLRAADLTRDGRVLPEGAAWRRLSKRDLQRRLLKDGDLMLERSGGGPGTPVGRVALIDGIGPVYCNNFCQQLRVDTTRCHPRFVHHALWHRYLRGVTVRLERQTTGIRNLDYPGYLSWPLPLPSMKEQHAISSTVAGCTDRLACLRAAHEAKQVLYASLSDLLLAGRLHLGAAAKER